jgi:hypothetical protein
MGTMVKVQGFLGNVRGKAVFGIGEVWESERHVLAITGDKCPENKSLRNVIKNISHFTT